jgi:hypothetical protein
LENTLLLGAGGISRCHLGRKYKRGQKEKKEKNVKDRYIDLSIERYSPPSFCWQVERGCELKILRGKILIKGKRKGENIKEKRTSQCKRIKKHLN